MVQVIGDETVDRDTSACGISCFLRSALLLMVFYCQLNTSLLKETFSLFLTSSLLLVLEWNRCAQLLQFKLILSYYSPKKLKQLVLYDSPRLSFHHCSNDVKLIKRWCCFTCWIKPQTVFWKWVEGKSYHLHIFSWDIQRKIILILSCITLHIIWIMFHTFHIPSSTESCTHIQTKINTAPFQIS